MQADRMHLAATDSRSPGLSLAVGLLDRDGQLVLGYFTEGFSQFTGGAAGCDPRLE